MPAHDRRSAMAPDLLVMRSRLNEAQLRMLRELEYFGWELKFVRHPSYSEPVPVVFAGDRAFLALRPDGSVDEQPALHVRPS